MNDEGFCDLLGSLIGSLGLHSHCTFYDDHGADFEIREMSTTVLGYHCRDHITGDGGCDPNRPVDLAQFPTERVMDFWVLQFQNY